MDKKFFWSTLIGSVVIVGALSFYGGIYFDKSKNSFAANFPGSAQLSRNHATAVGGQQGAGARSGSGMRVAGGALSGEILKIDSSSLTLKTADGSSRIIYLPDSAAINMMATGTKADLQVGKNIFITGDTGQDGTVTAKQIQVRQGIPSGNQTGAVNQ